MNQQKIKAFTLVELIVVVTILAILWTIAFISLQWYAKSARDSSRISDMKSITKVLDLFQLQSWVYPSPQDGVAMTYTWETVWTQWNFWDETRAQIWSRVQISSAPLDPLTWSKYTYSVLNTWTEYQIAWILEWWPLSYSPINSANAWDEIASAYITWNYNGSVAKVRKSSVDYILAVPTIINGDMTLTDVVQAMANNKMVYRWYQNLPATFSWTIFNTNGEPTINLIEDPSNNMLVYSWSIQDLTDPDNLQILADNLQTAYSWTDIASNSVVSSILSVDTSEPILVNQVVWSLVNNNISEDLITIETWSPSVSTPSSYTCLLQNTDYSSAMNNYGWFYNADTYPWSAFVSIKADGSLEDWWHNVSGWLWTPVDSWYTKVYTKNQSFAWLKSDWSITSWWEWESWPVDSWYTKIVSISSDFAALKSDGSLVTWWAPFHGWLWVNTPSGNGYTDIYSNINSFAALKSDWSIVSWWMGWSGWSGYPVDSGYTKIYSTSQAFAAIKADGSITAWWSSLHWWTWAPVDSGYVKIYSNDHAFAAMKADWSIVAWWNASFWWDSYPGSWKWWPESGYTKIFSTTKAFTALKSDWTVTSWWDAGFWWTWAPVDSGYTDVFSTSKAFAALKADWSISWWGDTWYLLATKDPPFDSWYVDIYSTSWAFAAIKADGSISVWWEVSSWWNGAPWDSGYVNIYSTETAFTAIKWDWTTEACWTSTTWWTVVSDWK